MNDRLICFIDVINFRNYFESISRDTSFDDMTSFLKTYSDLIDLNNKSMKVEGFDIEISAIFDSFLISISKPQESEVNIVDYLFWLAQDIQKQILWHFGLLSKGVFHVGELFHKRNIIMGVGYLNVIDYEKKQKMPALFATDEFVQACRDNSNITILECDDEENIKSFLRPSVYPKIRNLLEPLLKEGLRESNCEQHRAKWEFAIKYWI